MDFIQISAKTKSEAITKAAIELETSSDQLEIVVISEGSSGFLGFGSKPAIIKARRKEEPALEEEYKEIEKDIAKEKELVKTVREEVKVKEEKKPENKKPRKERPNRPAKAPRKEAASKEENKKEKAAKEKPAKVSKPIEVIQDPAEIEQIQETAKEFLCGVFKAMNLGNVEIKTSYNTNDGSLEINFDGDDMGILIGKRGQTLDSLQYLTSLVVNKGKNSYIRVKLDTEDYRRRRKETLENLAKGIAYKVRKTRKPVVLEPMNPYERRIIHSTLQSNKFVETISEGEEPYRHVVIKLKRQ